MYFSYQTAKIDSNLTVIRPCSRDHLIVLNELMISWISWKCSDDNNMYKGRLFKKVIYFSPYPFPSDIRCNMHENHDCKSYCISIKFPNSFPNFQIPNFCVCKTGPRAVVITWPWLWVQRTTTGPKLFPTVAKVRILA